MVMMITINLRIGPLEKARMQELQVVVKPFPIEKAPIQKYQKINEPQRANSRIENA